MHKYVYIVYKSLWKVKKKKKKNYYENQKILPITYYKENRVEASGMADTLRNWDTK